MPLTNIVCSLYQYVTITPSEGSLWTLAVGHETGSKAPPTKWYPIHRCEWMIPEVNPLRVFFPLLRKIFTAKKLMKGKRKNWLQLLTQLRKIAHNTWPLTTLALKPLSKHVILYCYFNSSPMYEIALLCMYVNPLKTKGRLLYLKTQFVPRSKHFLSRL